MNISHAAETDPRLGSIQGHSNKNVSGLPVNEHQRFYANTYVIGSTQAGRAT